MATVALTAAAEHYSRKELSRLQQRRRRLRISLFACCSLTTLETRHWTCRRQALWAPRWRWPQQGGPMKTEAERACSPSAAVEALRRSSGSAWWGCALAAPWRAPRRLRPEEPRRLPCRRPRPRWGSRRRPTRAPTTGSCSRSRRAIAEQGPGGRTGWRWCCSRR